MSTHPEGCVCAGLSSVCPVALRRAEVVEERRRLLDRSEALVAAAAGEPVPVPHVVLDPHEVLKQFTEGQG